MDHKPAEQIANAADALYVAAAAASVDEEGRRSRIFSQDTLLGYAGVDKSAALMPLIQYLNNKGLFRTLKVAGKLGWSVRPREAARQIMQLEREEKMIYEVVEEAHTTGIWVRDLKKKVTIAPNTVTKALNKMEKSCLIKGVKSVKNPAQRTYMLFHLQPSEDVTGNSFFDAGDLDESFRDELLNLIVFFVRQNSWAESSRKKNKRSEPILDDSELHVANKKRKRTTDIEDMAHPATYPTLNFNPETDFKQLAYKAGTHNYPTAEHVLTWLTGTGAIKPTKSDSLTVQEIQGCLDVLCWDDRLEKVPTKDGIAWGYRTVRGQRFNPTETIQDIVDRPGPGFTQSPCGRCPVFDVCHEGGPVNPQECVYFDEWLK